MLDFMRRQHKKLKWVWVAIIVVLGGGMVVAYIPFSDLGSISLTGNDVAKVGSETVTAAEFRNTYTNYVKNMQQQLTPEIRKAFGFDKPILHGLCSFGIAGRAVLKLAAGNDPARLAHMQVRFTAPAYPGETIRTEIWRDGKTVSFRARALERDAVILNNGLATIRDLASGIRHQ